jgi:hypothetical protein
MRDNMKKILLIFLPRAIVLSDGLKLNTRHSPDLDGISPKVRSVFPDGIMDQVLGA